MKSSYFCSLFLTAVLLLGISLGKVSAEGTKQLQPNPAFISNLRVNGGNSTNTGNNAGFLANAKEALYIHIQNFSQERIYFGFAAYLPGNVYVRLKDPTGAIVYGPVLIPSVAAPGFINSYTEAFNGPAQLQAGGYNALSYNPTQNGDYTIELNLGSPSVANTTVLDIKFYDVTVGNTVSMTAIPGRLYAYMWGMSTDSYSVPTEATYYAYTEDQVVTTLSLNGITPFAYGVYCNRTGVFNTGNIVTDRRSRQWRQAPLPQYKLFLNDPDPVDYPSGSFPTLTRTTKISGCAATGYCIEVAIDKAADAEVFLDLNGNGVYNAGTVDVLLNRKVAPGVNCIPWNGKDGLGATVATGTNITGYVKAIAGLTNFPVFDAENNFLGVKAGIVRPASPPPVMFWDDSNLGGTSNLTGAPSPSHAWAGDFGNERVMNTWWYTYVINTSFAYTILPQCPPVAMPDNAEVCPNTTLTFNPLLNDTDAEGDIFTGSISIITSPLHGTATANSAGTITYVPAPGYTGLDTLTYQVCDGSGLCSNQAGSYGKVYINIGPAFSLSATKVCNGGTDGTISFFTNNANLSYGHSTGNTYTGADPPTTSTVNGVNTITGLSQGLHTIRLYNGSCAVDKTIYIDNNPSPTLTLSFLPFCPGGTTTVSFPATSASYRYDYSSGATYTGAAVPAAYITANGSNSVNALPQGTYTVRLFESATSCHTDQTITPVPGGTANPTFGGITVSNTCGNALGAISFTATAGFNYDYTSGIYYSGPTPPSAYTVAAGANVIPNLNLGAYTLRLKNNTTSCFKDTSLNISSNNPLLDLSKKDICGGVGNGTITFPTTTTALRYNYSAGSTYTGSVPPGTATLVGTNTITGLAANNYTVRLHNPGNGCFTNKTITIANSSAPSYALSKSDACGGGFGSISFPTTTPGLKYDFSTGGIYTGEVPPDSNTTVVGNNFITQLVANTYTVRVSNPATGCFLDQSIPIVANPNPNLALAMTGATCNDGAITFNTAVAGLKYDFTSGGVYSKSPPPSTFTTINGTNTIGVLPAAFYTVRLHDAGTGCFTDQTIQVAKAANCPPTALDNIGATNEEVSVVLPVVAYNDSDQDGVVVESTIDLDPTAVGIQTTYTNSTGMWTVSPGGNVSYTPALDYTGTATIKYTINDNGGSLSNQANLSVTVTNLNDPPVAVDNSSSTPESVAVSFNVASNDTDVDGTVDPNTIDLDPGTPGDQKTFTTPQGTYTVNASGVVSFTPVAGFNGTATVTYTIKDNNGAVSNPGTITMTVIPAPSATPVTTHVLCNGGTNGSITFTSPTGGIAPYTYSFNGSPYTVTTSYTGLAAGTYTLSIRDANLSVAALPSQTVNQPGLLSATITPGNVLCNGLSTGTVSISSPNGGVAPYEYNFNTAGFSVATSYPNLAAGNYTVSMRDANGCSVSLPNASVTQPAVQSATVTPSNVTCNGASTGSVTISSASGGVGPYTYNFNGSGFSAATSYPNLAAGTYAVSMRDANLCVISLPAQTITQPAVQSANVSPTNVLCNAGSTGAVNITMPAGGVAPYTYSFNGSGYTTTMVYSGLTAGSYTVSMRDANMCIMALPNQTINQPAMQSATVTKTDVTCNGASTGAVGISSPLGGAGTYTYSFNGSGFAATTSFTNLFAGTYPLSMRDANNCIVALASQTITQPSALNASVSNTAASCAGNDGTISISTPMGGTGAYSYSINGAAFSTSLSFTGLSAGSYTVSMRDANGCTQALPTQNITQPSGLSATAAATPVTCNGGSNGSISITGSGGVAPYTFSFSGGSFASATNFTGLAAGTYPMSLKDASGCIFTLAPTVVPEPLIQEANVLPAAVNCNGANTGSITISVPTGGVAPYTYSFDGSAFSSTTTYSGLSAGTYTLSMKDANSCVLSLPTQTISQPGPLSATVTPTSVNCFGASTGSITISSPSGGISPYSYSVNGNAFSTVTSFATLPAGSYTLRMQDDNLCIIALPGQTIMQPALQSATVTNTPPGCNGASTGSVSISAPSGGIPPYTYSFNGSAFTPTTSYSNLAAGNYPASIQDANNCIVSLQTQTVTQPAPLSASVSSTAASCAGNDGSLTISSAAGGTTPYEYSIYAGGFTSSLSYANLGAGTYSVNMRDANGCTLALPSQNITQPSGLAATGASSHVTCYGGSDGSVDIVNASGGVPPYTYSFNGNSYVAAATFSGLVAGSYAVRLRDASGCIYSLPNQVVNEPAVISALSRISTITCNGKPEGSIEVYNVAGGIKPYVFSLNSGAYNVDSSYHLLPQGVHTVRIRDASSCEVTLPSQTITQLDILNANVNPVGVTGCNGNINGRLNVTNAVGGSGKYRFSIDNGTTWPGFGNNFSFSNLTAGIYSLSIQDSLNPGCIIKITGPFTITQPDSLNADFELNDVTACAGNKNGAITIKNATGGSGAYEYSITSGSVWDGSGSPYTYDRLGAGTYDVWIRDKNDSTCFYSLYQNLDIKEPIKISAITKIDSVSVCSGFNNGAIIITTPEGGSGMYEYSKNGGANWTSPTSAGFSFTSLNSGSYEVLARDANFNNCVVVLKSPAVVNDIEPLAGSISSSVVTECHGKTNGTITLTNVKGGSGKYDFSIDGEQSWSGNGNSFTFPNLKAGPYTISVRDSLYPMCNKILAASYPILEPAKLVTTILSTDVTECHGLANGRISLLNSSGGSGNYEYTIDNGFSWIRDGASHNFLALPQGTYKVMMRDADFPSCTLDVNTALTLSQPAALSAQITANDIKDCFGANSGSLKLTTVAGGSTNYEFSIDGGNSWSADPQFDSLRAGIYQVQMRDATYKSCVKNLNSAIALSQPAQLAASITIADVDGCEGANNGNIAFKNASGGSGQYEYSIKTGEWVPVAFFTNLAPGNYLLQIRDANFTACAANLNANATISHPDPDQPPVITDHPKTQGPICEKTADIRFAVTVTGTDLKYSWFQNGNLIQSAPESYTGENTNTLSINSPSVAYNNSSFSVVVSGKCGTDTSFVATLRIDSASVAGTVTGSGEFCVGSNGLVIQTSNYTGAITGWQKSEGELNDWENKNVSTSTLNPGILFSTTRFRPVVKSGVCAAKFGLPVLQSAVQKPSAAYAGEDQTICGTTVDLEANSPETGVGQWILLNNVGGQIANAKDHETHLSGDPKNSYSLMWQVTNGICVPSMDTVVVTLKTPVVAAVSENVVISIGSQTIIKATGGTRYVWQNIGDSTLSNYLIGDPASKPRLTTIYHVLVSNDEGCRDSASVMVGIEGVQVPNAFSPDGDNNHDLWKIDNILIYPNAELRIYNRWGQQVGNLSGNELIQGWDGKSNGADLPLGTYFYILKLNSNAVPTNGSITLLK